MSNFTDCTYTLTCDLCGEVISPGLLHYCPGQELKQHLLIEEKTGGKRMKPLTKQQALALKGEIASNMPFSMEECKILSDIIDAHTEMTPEEELKKYKCPKCGGALMFGENEIYCECCNKIHASGGPLSKQTLVDEIKSMECYKDGWPVL